MHTRSTAPLTNLFDASHVALLYQLLRHHNGQPQRIPGCLQHHLIAAVPHLCSYLLRCRALARRMIVRYRTGDTPSAPVSAGALPVLGDLVSTINYFRMREILVY